MARAFDDILFEVSIISVLDDGDLTKAADIILRSCSEGLNVDRVGIWLMNNKSSQIQCKFLREGNSINATESLCLTREQYPAYFDALAHERTIAADDALTHPATAEFTEGYLKPLGISSMLDVPIRHFGKMIGIICCEHKGPSRVWSSEECTFASSLADLYGRAQSAYQRNLFEQELVDLNTSLEQKVAERTRQLAATVDELKSTHASLIESEKMASLGRLVSGIAHEVNTPLGVAVSATSYSLENLSAIGNNYQGNQFTKKLFEEFLEDQKESLELAQKNLSRASDLIQSFKQIAVEQHHESHEPCNVADYVKTIVQATEKTLSSSGISLTLDIEETGNIYTYPGVIGQILTGLINNSIEHGFRNYDIEDEKIVIVHCFMENERAIISIKDNGRGIDQSDQHKVFEPFFTTARNHGSTGLGLSVIYNLATHKLKGGVEVQSGPGQGCEIRFWIVDLIRQNRTAIPNDLN